MPLWRYILAAMATAMLMSALPASAADATGKFRIVMLTWRGWTDTDQGFKDYLEGQKVPVELIQRDADGDPNKVKAYVKEIKTSLKPDLVYVWGTNVANAALGPYDTPNKDDFLFDVPVVFANISHPVQGRFVQSADHPGRMATGSFYLVPVSSQVRLMQNYREFDRLGVIFNPLESNAQVEVAQLRESAKTMRFELYERPIKVVDGRPLIDDIAVAVQDVADKRPGYLYIPPDSFLSTNKNILTAAALKARLPTFAAAEGTIKDSDAMMGLIARYYNVGKLTGLQAEKILVEKRKPEDIPVANLSRFSFVLNVRVVTELGFYPPIGLIRIAEAIDVDRQQSRVPR